MFIGNLFVFVASVYIFRCLRTRIFHLDISIFSFIFLYTATLYTFILGLAKLLEPNKIALISMVGLTFLFIPALRNRKQWISFFRVQIGSLRSVRISKLGALLLLLALLQLARILFHVWYLSPYVWDTMTYHLPNVAEWVQKQHLHAITTPVTRSYWPATFEVLETWFAVFLHHDILIQLGGVLCYFVAGMSVYAMARILGTGNLLSACIALFYLYTPSLAIHATSCNTDLPVAAAYLLSMAIILDLLKNGERESFPLANRVMIVLMAQSFGFGSKAYTAFLLPALLMLGVVAFKKHHLFRKVGRLFLPKTIPSASKVALYTVLILGSGILGFYWYLRNWVVFDNPFHPTDFRMLGHLIFGTGDAPQYASGQRGSISLIALWENTRALVTDRIFDQHGAFTSDLGNMSGWGWFSFVSGIPALFYAIIFARGYRLLILSFALSLMGLFAGITVDPWYMRFTLWFPAIFALSFAALITNLRNKWIKGCLIALAAMCTIFNFIAVLNAGVFLLDDFPKMMATPPLFRSTAKLTRYNEGAYKETLARVPEDEIIGYNVDDNDWIYPLYDSDLSRHLMYVPIDNLSFIPFMKQHRINYLFVGRTGAIQNQLLEKAVQDGFLEKITGYLYALK